MPKNSKAVLFDMDGVLVDSMEAWFHTYNDTLEQFGFSPISTEEFLKTGGRSVQNDIKYQFTHCEEKELMDAFTKNFLPYADKAILDPDVQETVKYLKSQHKKIGVVTNASREIVTLLLQPIGVLDQFDVVVGGDDVSNGKPDPEGILNSCETLGVEPSELLFVGDTINDEGAAQAAGCEFVHYSTHDDGSSLLETVKEHTA